MVYVYGRGDMS